MMNVEELINSIQAFNDDLIIGRRENKEGAIAVYNLPKQVFEAKTNKYVLCGQIAQLFQEKVGGKLVLLYHVGVSNWNSLKLGADFVNAVVEQKHDVIKKYENQLLFDSAVPQGTHMVLEVMLDKTYVVDPTAGIVYPWDLKQLLSTNAYYDAWRFHNQHVYLAKSIHACRGFHLSYVTSVFWKNIVRTVYV
jgi:hypothetical protein